MPHLHSIKMANNVSHGYMLFQINKQVDDTGYNEATLLISVSLSYRCRCQLQKVYQMNQRVWS